MDTCTIYSITNTRNGKRYVGQTWQTLQQRWTRHCWTCTTGSNMPISHAIAKYGRDSFIIEPLVECTTQEEADQMEVHYVDTLNTWAPNGYNLRAGRAAGRMSDETKEKIGRSNRDKRRTDETRRRLSESHKGKKLSIEARAKLSEHMKSNPIDQEWRARLSAGASRASEKTYVLISPGGEETTITNMKQFCQKNGLLPSKMSNVVTGKRNHHRGWRLPRKEQVLT